MPPNRPTHATMYDFRDTDIMWQIAENANGSGITSHALAELLGFEVEETTARPIGVRLARMRSYGMVAFDDDQRTWSLTRGGRRVIQAHELAPKLRVVEQMPDEQMIEVMAHVTSRFQRGDSMLAHMLRREFFYGTKRR